MVLVALPMALSVPLFTIEFSPLNLTTTPGWIVSVTPEFTVTVPLTMNVLEARVHVVLVVIVPETVVLAYADEGKKNAAN